jgi:hypothetical protein
METESPIKGGILNTATFRVDRVEGDHVHCTLFMNGASCGNLCFRVGEYQVFGAALLMGAEASGNHLAVYSDDAVFVKWARAQGVDEEEA